MSENTCEEKVFKSIFFKHAEEVRNFIYYKSGNLAQAEDLTQEAFAKLWENCKKVPFSKARACLYTLVRNTFFNQLAHKKVVLEFEQKQKPKQDEQSPDYLMEMKEFHHLLQQAIAALPVEQRLVFLMNRVDKKKYKEIAL